MTKLWEVEHDYYCTEGNLTKFVSWQDYMEEWADVDMDYNLLFRWDMYSTDSEDEPLPDGEKLLRLFYMLQRKGYHITVEIAIHESDESAIREFLQTRFEHLKKLWLPLA